MTNAPEPTADPGAPPAARSRRRRLAALLHPGILLATTGLVAAFDPKLPPFKGD